MATVISKLSNGRLMLTIDSRVYIAPKDLCIVPHVRSVNLIKLGATFSDNNFNEGISIDWTNITSPVVLSRNDAIEKIALLLDDQAWVEEFETIGGSGASITTTKTLSGLWKVFVDGLLHDTPFYTQSGNDINFAPAIADGKVITVIKFG